MRAFRKLRRLNSAGDTIVEVLIVLAVLGLAMSVSYATATKGLQKSRTAQEHTQALGIINSQIELLRSAFAKQDGAAIEAKAAAGPFCLSTSGGNVVASSIVNTGPVTSKFNENVANDVLAQPPYAAACVRDTVSYYVSIVGRGGGVYDVRVRWEGLGSQGRQQEEITYKIGNVTISPTSGYGDGETPPPPVVIPAYSLALSANPNTVNPGSSFTLDWFTAPAAGSCRLTGNSDAVNIRSFGSGNRGVAITSLNVADHGTRVITVPITVGSITLTYNMTCTSGSDTDTKSVSVTVGPYIPLLTPVYRSYSTSSRDHFYSTNESEGPNAGYRPQGSIGKVDTRQGANEIPLYRMYNGIISDHFYTTDADEVNRINGVGGWVQESTVGYIKPYPSSGGCPAGTKELYRMYSSALTEHFYTTDIDEYAQGYDSHWVNSNYGPYGPYDESRGPNRRWTPYAIYDLPEGVIGCIYN